MKTTLTSNWRPLLRALYPFLIAAAALWAMPKNACAQLYVTELTGGGLIGVVDKYDAKTGAAISPSFITGLNRPALLAVKGNTLFVANEFGGTVGKYDATTGAAINASFIIGLGAPEGLAVLGNTLFVANFGGGTVGEYDAKTGAAINATFITGLNGPGGLAVKSAK
jgi:hypothetical protein